MIYNNLPKEILETYVVLAVKAFALLFLLPLNRFDRAIMVSVFPLPLLGSHSFSLTLPSLIVEFSTGLLCGLPVFFLLSLARTAGELIDATRGQMVGTILNPRDFQMDSPGGALIFHVMISRLLGTSFFLIAVSGYYLVDISKVSLREFVNLLKFECEAFAIFLVPIVIAFLISDVVITSIWSIMSKDNMNGILVTTRSIIAMILLSQTEHYGFSNYSLNLLADSLFMTLGF